MALIPCEFVKEMKIDVFLGKNITRYIEYTSWPIEF